jgi:hypothetical protein
MDAAFSTPLKHPAEGGANQFLAAIKELEIDETNTLQSEGKVVLSIENRVCD